MVDTLTGALIGAITSLAGALAWMTIGRFQDRERYADKVAELHRELAEAQQKQLERVFVLTHEQSVAIATHAAALNGLSERISSLRDAAEDTTQAVNGIVRDVVRDARAGRRTVSDSTMQAVQRSVEQALEQAATEKSDRRRGGGR